MMTCITVSFKSDDMKELLDNISDNIKHDCSRGSCYCDNNITYPDVVAAVGKIKEHKSGVNDSFSSDHIVNDCHELYVQYVNFIQDYVVTLFCS